MCIAMVCNPGCDVMNSGVRLTFLIKSFSYLTKMSLQKLKYLENETILKTKQKTFSIIFKGLSMKQITDIFLEGESSTLRPVTLVLSD